MTIEKVREELPNFEDFANICCDCCQAVPDGYCPSYCHELEKAEKMDYERILKCLARNDGDLIKVLRYIRSARVQKWIKNLKKN